jgi:hypothetical protein
VIDVIRDVFLELPKELEKIRCLRGEGFTTDNEIQKKLCLSDIVFKSDKKKIQNKGRWQDSFEALSRIINNL